MEVNSAPRLDALLCNCGTSCQHSTTTVQGDAEYVSVATDFDCKALTQMYSIVCKKYACESLEPYASDNSNPKARYVQAQGLDESVKADQVRVVLKTYPNVTTTL